MNPFGRGIVWRVVGLVVMAVALGYGWWTWAGFRWPLALAGATLLIWQTAGLYRYVTSLNRKLERFLESVQYADFAVSFRADSALGPSFQAVNQQFNAVLDAFRQARAEQEASLNFLNTIVQHVSVGLLAFDAAGQVELSNQTALRLLGIYRLRTLSELPQPRLATLLRDTRPGQSVVFSGEGIELSIRCTNVRLRGRLLTLVSLQNIHSELQQKELDSWQNLTKVLRHEIMNSITPIVSLAGTMQQIVEHDLPPDGPTAEAVADLRLALGTIESRGQGIMRFVDAYRHFTTLPPPRPTDVAVDDLLTRVAGLVQSDARKQGATLHLGPPTNITLLADAEQVEMVLLNLLKNAFEAAPGHDRLVAQHSGHERPAAKPPGHVWLKAQPLSGRTVITVQDNGPGIAPDALDDIFIPFYTTKAGGTGIGLSLSRQIMLAHGGELRVTSPPGAGATFSLVF